MAPESLFSASDDVEMGEGLGGLLTAFWHPTLSPGRYRKTCTPLVRWLVLISSIFCDLPKGAGVNPGRHRRGLRVLGRFAPLETLREICPMYLGLDRRHLGPYHYQEKGFRYPIDEHDLRPGRHDQTGLTCHLTCQGQCENLRQNRGWFRAPFLYPPYNR